MNSRPEFLQLSANSGISASAGIDAHCDCGSISAISDIRSLTAGSSVDTPYHKASDMTTLQPGQNRPRDEAPRGVAEITR